MASRITREGERNIRSNDLLQENKADFAANAFATTKIEELEAGIGNTGNFFEDQLSSDGGARQQYDIAEETYAKLKDAMREIADFAATMEDEIDGIEENFRIPRTGGKRARIARARAFATDAAPHEAIFVGRGLDADFIENLTNLVDALENALSSAVSKTANRVGATESKLQSHKKANKIISMLDPIVRKRYANDAAKLAP